jgi:tetratricopeptide (TPR) repeat protein
VSWVLHSTLHGDARKWPDAPGVRASYGCRYRTSAVSSSANSWARAVRRLQIPLDDCEGGGIALSFLASMTVSRGDMAGALALYRQAEETFVRLGDKPEIARVQCEAGYVALAADRVEDALRSFQRALRTYDEVGSPRGTGQALMGLAAAEAAQGNTERAVAIAAAAEVMSRRAGVVIEHPLAPGWPSASRRSAPRCRARSWRRCWCRGAR